MNAGGKERPVCPGCMRPYKGGACRRCGELPEGLYVPFALEAGTMLGEEAILGRALNAGEDFIQYIGYDQKAKRRVLVRELFVPALLIREEDGSVRFRDSAAKEEVSRLVRHWEQREKRLLAWNNTVYAVLPYPSLP